MPHIIMSYARAPERPHTLQFTPPHPNDFSNRPGFVSRHCHCSLTDGVCFITIQGQRDGLLRTRRPSGATELTEASLSGVPGHPGPALGADWSALPTPCPRRAQTHRRGAPGARFDAPTTGSDWGRVGSATSPNRTRVVAKLYESFNLKKAVEPTQRRKGAETQGFRLVGAITHWVS